MDNPDGRIGLSDISGTNSAESLRLLKLIHESFLDKSYQTDAYWRIADIKKINVPHLEKAFQQKKAEIQKERSPEEAQEEFLFTCYNCNEHISVIAHQGLLVQQSRFNFLGNSLLGIILCKHADVQLKAAQNDNQERCWLMVFKVLYGRKLSIHPVGNFIRRPTIGADCHVSSIPPMLGETLGCQAIKSQVYLYEVDSTSSTGFSLRPRQCVPQAYVEFVSTGNPVLPALQIPHPSGVCHQRNSSSHLSSFSNAVLIRGKIVPPLSQTGSAKPSSRHVSGSTHNIPSDKLQVTLPTKPQNSLLSARLKSPPAYEDVIGQPHLGLQQNIPGYLPAAHRTNDVGIILDERLKLLPVCQNLIIQLLQNFAKEMNSVAGVWRTSGCNTQNTPFLQGAVAAVQELRQLFQRLAPVCQQFYKYVKDVFAGRNRHLPGIGLIQCQLSVLNSCQSAMSGAFKELHLLIGLDLNPIQKGGMLAQAILSAKHILHQGLTKVQSSLLETFNGFYDDIQPDASSGDVPAAGKFSVRDLPSLLARATISSGLQQQQEQQRPQQHSAVTPQNTPKLSPSLASLLAMANNHIADSQDTIAKHSVIQQCFTSHNAGNMYDARPSETCTSSANDANVRFGLRLPIVIAPDDNFIDEVINMDVKPQRKELDSSTTSVLTSIKQEKVELSGIENAPEIVFIDADEVLPECLTINQTTVKSEVINKVDSDAEGNCAKDGLVLNILDEQNPGTSLARVFCVRPEGMNESEADDSRRLASEQMAAEAEVKDNGSTVLISCSEAKAFQNAGSHNFIDERDSLSCAKKNVSSLSSSLRDLVMQPFTNNVANCQNSSTVRTVGVKTMLSKKANYSHSLRKKSAECKRLSINKFSKNSWVCRIYLTNKVCHGRRKERVKGKFGCSAESHKTSSAVSKKTSAVKDNKMAKITAQDSTQNGCCSKISCPNEANTDNTPVFPLVKGEPDETCSQTVCVNYISSTEDLSTTRGDAKTTAEDTKILLIEPAAQSHSDSIQSTDPSIQVVNKESDVKNANKDPVSISLGRASADKSDFRLRLIKPEPADFETSKATQEQSIDAKLIAEVVASSVEVNSSSFAESTEGAGLLKIKIENVCSIAPEGFENMDAGSCVKTEYGHDSNDLVASECIVKPCIAAEPLRNLAMRENCNELSTETNETRLRSLPAGGEPPSPDEEFVDVGDAEYGITVNALDQAMTNANAVNCKKNDILQVGHFGDDVEIDVMFENTSSESEDGTNQTSQNDTSKCKINYEDLENSDEVLKFYSLGGDHYETGLNIMSCELDEKKIKRRVANKSKGVKRKRRKSALSVRGKRRRRLAIENQVVDSESLERHAHNEAIGESVLGELSCHAENSLNVDCSVSEFDTPGKRNKSKKYRKRNDKSVAGAVSVLPEVEGIAIRSERTFSENNLNPSEKLPECVTADGKDSLFQTMTEAVPCAGAAEILEQPKKKPRRKRSANQNTEALAESPEVAVKAPPVSAKNQFLNSDASLNFSGSSFDAGFGLIRESLSTKLFEDDTIGEERPKEPKTRNPTEKEYNEDESDIIQNVLNIDGNKSTFEGEQTLDQPMDDDVVEQPNSRNTKRRRRRYAMTGRPRRRRRTPVCSQKSKTGFVASLENPVQKCQTDEPSESVEANESLTVEQMNFPLAFDSHEVADSLEVTTSHKVANMHKVSDIHELVLSLYGNGFSASDPLLQVERRTSPRKKGVSLCVQSDSTKKTVHNRCRRRKNRRSVSANVKVNDDSSQATLLNILNDEKFFETLKLAVETIGNSPSSKDGTKLGNSGCAFAPEQGTSPMYYTDIASGFQDASGNEQKEEILEKSSVNSNFPSSYDESGHREQNADLVATSTSSSCLDKFEAPSCFSTVGGTLDDTSTASVACTELISAVDGAGAICYDSIRSALKTIANSCYSSPNNVTKTVELQTSSTELEPSVADQSDSTTASTVASVFTQGVSDGVPVSKTGTDNFIQDPSTSGGHSAAKTVIPLSVYLQNTRQSNYQHMKHTEGNCTSPAFYTGVVNTPVENQLSHQYSYFNDPKSLHVARISSRDPRLVRMRNQSIDNRAVQQLEPQFQYDLADTSPQRRNTPLGFFHSLSCPGKMELPNTVPKKPVCSISPFICKSNTLSSREQDSVATTKVDATEQNSLPGKRRTSKDGSWSLLPVSGLLPRPPVVFARLLLSERKVSGYPSDPRIRCDRPLSVYKKLSRPDQVCDSVSLVIDESDTLSTVKSRTSSNAMKQSVLNAVSDFGVSKQIKNYKFMDVQTTADDNKDTKNSLELCKNKLAPNDDILQDLLMSLESETYEKERSEKAEGGMICGLNKDRVLGNRSNLIPNWNINPEKLPQKTRKVADDDTASTSHLTKKTSREVRKDRFRVTSEGVNGRAENSAQHGSKQERDDKSHSKTYLHRRHTKDSNPNKRLHTTKDDIRHHCESRNSNVRHRERSHDRRHVKEPTSRSSVSHAPLSSPDKVEERLTSDSASKDSDNPKNEHLGTKKTERDSELWHRKEAHTLNFKQCESSNFGEKKVETDGEKEANTCGNVSVKCFHNAKCKASHDERHLKAAPDADSLKRRRDREEALGSEGSYGEAKKFCSREMNYQDSCKPDSRQFAPLEDRVESEIRPLNCQEQVTSLESQSRTKEESERAESLVKQTSIDVDRSVKQCLYTDEIKLETGVSLTTEEQKNEPKGVRNQPDENEKQPSENTTLIQCEYQPIPTSTEDGKGLEGEKCDSHAVDAKDDDRSRVIGSEEEPSGYKGCGNYSSAIYQDNSPQERHSCKGLDPKEAAGDNGLLPDCTQECFPLPGRTSQAKSNILIRAEILKSIYNLKLSLEDRLKSEVRTSSENVVKEEVADAQNWSQDDMSAEDPALEGIGTGKCNKKLAGETPLNTNECIEKQQDEPCSVNFQTSLSFVTEASGSTSRQSEKSLPETLSKCSDDCNREKLNPSTKLHELHVESELQDVTGHLTAKECQFHHEESCHLSHLVSASLMHRLSDSASVSHDDFENECADIQTSLFQQSNVSERASHVDETDNQQTSEVKSFTMEKESYSSTDETLLTVDAGRCESFVDSDIISVEPQPVSVQAVSRKECCSLDSFVTNTRRCCTADVLDNEFELEGNGNRKVDDTTREVLPESSPSVYLKRCLSVSDELPKAREPNNDEHQESREADVTGVTGSCCSSEIFLYHAGASSSKKSSVGHRTSRRPSKVINDWKNISLGWTELSKDYDIPDTNEAADDGILSYIKLLADIPTETLAAYKEVMKREVAAAEQKVLNSLVFLDPCDGLTENQIRKLLRTKSTNASVERELRLACDTLTLEKDLADTHSCMEEIKNQLSLHPSSALDKMFDEQEQRYSFLLVTKDMYHYRLTKFRRYQKSRFVHVIPNEFLFDDEIDNYLSLEGMLLFLRKPTLSVISCVRLAALKSEIQHTQTVLARSSLRLKHDTKQLKFKLGWLHLERKLHFQELCCTTSQDQQRLIRYIQDKLTWYRSLVEEIDVRSDPQASDMQDFVRETVGVFDAYAGVLNSVEKSASDGLWKWSSQNTGTKNSERSRSRSRSRGSSFHDKGRDFPRNQRPGHGEFESGRNFDSTSKNDGILFYNQERSRSYDDEESWNADNRGNVVEDCGSARCGYDGRKTLRDCDGEKERWYREKYSYHGDDSDDTRSEEVLRNWYSDGLSYGGREETREDLRWELFNRSTEPCEMFDVASRSRVYSDYGYPIHGYSDSSYSPPGCGYLNRDYSSRCQWKWPQRR